MVRISRPLNQMRGQLLVRFMSVTAVMLVLMLLLLKQLLLLLLFLLLDICCVELLVEPLLARRLKVFRTW